MSKIAKVCPSCDSKIFCPECGCLIKDEEKSDDTIDFMTGVFVTLFVAVVTMGLIYSLFIIIS